MADEDLGGTQTAQALNDNRRLTGARKTVPAGPESAAGRNARHADETRKPGLRRAPDEVDGDTHQSDGVNRDRMEP